MPAHTPFEIAVFFRSITHYRGLVVTTLMLFIGLSGCGTSDGKQMTPRERAQRRALHTLEAHQREFGRRLVCVRFPQSGPTAILLAKLGAGPYAGDLLRRLNIPGAVEIRSLGEYSREMGELERYVQKHIPHKFRTLAHEEGNSFFGLVCTRGHIDLPARGHVPSDLLAWAKRMVRRFGSDRIDYRYYNGPKAA